ncbi:hypothetical protein GDO86_018373, partial [Hymenochirus boettgeri]
PWWKSELFWWEPVLFVTWDLSFTSCMTQLWIVLSFDWGGGLWGNSGVLLGDLIPGVFCCSCGVVHCACPVYRVCGEVRTGSCGVYYPMFHRPGRESGGNPVGYFTFFGQGVCCS